MVAPLLAVLLGPRVARAADPPAVPKGLEGSALLDARAPVFAALNPTDLGDGFALMDLVGGIFPEAMRALNRVRDGLGLYAFSRGEFVESGVDPDALVLASWGTADGDAWAARRKGGPRTLFVRHRFVVRTLDGERFLRAAQAILVAAQASVADFSRARGETTAAPKAIPLWAAGHDLRTLVRNAGVLVLARARDGAIVTVRRASDEYAIIDYAEPWGGDGEARGETGPALAGIVARMVAPPRQALSAAIAQGTRRLLASEGVSVALVVEPGALAPLFARPSCRKDWAAADGALFEDAAILLRLHPFQWRLEVVWGLTAQGRTRLAGAASDDGILDGRTAAADGIAAAGLLLDGFDAIRLAPRPPVLSGNLARAVGSLDGCGVLAWVAAGARFWPQLAALEVERLTAPVAAKGSGALGALRNVAAVVRHLPDGHEGWQSATVLLGSLPASTEATVMGTLTRQASGRPETQSFGERLPTFFDLSATTGLSEAGIERIAGGHLTLALTPQAAGLGWYYRLARKPAKLGPQTRIGYLHLNLARLLEASAEEADRGTRAAVRLAAGQLGQLGGNMTLDGDFVRLELNLSANQ